MKKFRLLEIPHFCAFFSYYIGKGILFLFLIFLSNCTSKPNEKQNLNSETSFSKEFDEIYKLNYQNPALARKKSIEILEKIGEKDIPSKIKSLKYIGSSYTFESNYTEAIKYYNEALEFANEINDHFEIGNLNNNLGTIYNELGNYNSAYLYFLKALDEYDLAGEKEKKTGTLTNIGLTFMKLGNFEKALSHFEQALENNPQDTIMISTILNNTASCYHQKKDFEKALQLLDQAITFSESVKNQYSRCISYQIKGTVLLDKGDLENAYKALQKSIEIAEEGDLYYQIGSSKIALSRVFLAQNKPKEALQLADEVKHIAEEKNAAVLKVDVHQLYSNIYEATGNFKESLHHFKEYFRTKEEYNNASIVNQIYNTEVNQLNQLNKMQKLDLEKKELAISKKNNLLLFISTTFVLGLMGLYLAYRNHQHKQKVKLQETILELTKKKSNAVLEAEIRERKRIGRELHDGLGYLLSLAGLNASVLLKKKDISEEKRKEILNSLMESIDEAFDEVRAISHNLAPSLLSEQGLRGALKNISDKVNQTHQLKMSFDLFGLDEKLDDLIENVLYRTIQEIVNNTLKHAEAQNLFIQIAKDSNQITLMAEDDGKGFDSHAIQNKSSFGLSHIKSWIENLNGSIHIDSQVNRGTIISIFIPLEESKEI